MKKKIKNPCEVVLPVKPKLSNGMLVFPDGEEIVCKYHIVTEYTPKSMKVECFYDEVCLNAFVTCTSEMYYTKDMQLTVVETLTIQNHLPPKAYDTLLETVRHQKVNTEVEVNVTKATSS